MDMDENTLVSCVDCVNWESLKPKTGFFGCRTQCKNCICFGCDCYAPDSEIKLKNRPKFIKKDYGENDIIGFVRY